MSSLISNSEEANDSQRTFLEIAIFNASSAQIAYTSFADRLELCAEGSSVNGGTTPSLSTLESVITSLQRTQSSTIPGKHHATPTQAKRWIPIYTMIRPRGGDFVYSDEEFETMKEHLLALKSANYHQAEENKSHERNGFGKVNGFVFGILTRDNKVDRERNAELVRLAAPLPCTFHRAFDEVITSCENRVSDSDENMLLPQMLVDELTAVIEAGFASILTSGGSGISAVDGTRKIATLTEAAKGRIEIIAGGGVRSTNVRELRRQSPRTRFFHSSAIMGYGDEQVVDVADSNEVFALKTELMVPLGSAKRS
ncbi:copper homeostasis protein [Talaromyces pinophilus]|uniref:Copper homeostasis protein cutC homolog n=1 Tax=Talaromyces pinophilus TaxID=128442 RepID=A0A6V8HEH7_TALPI|nr:copper homeostasis protein [Talaromyces pinophilus]